MICIHNSSPQFRSLRTPGTAAPACLPSRDSHGSWREVQPCQSDCGHVPADCVRAASGAREEPRRERPGRRKCGTGPSVTRSSDDESRAAACIKGMAPQRFPALQPKYGTLPYCLSYGEEQTLSRWNMVVESLPKWVKMMTNELQAGSWKVIAEGRESGSVGKVRLLVGFTHQISACIKILLF